MPATVDSLSGSGSHPQAPTSLHTRFGVWVGVVVLLAFLVREYFVLVTVVDIPIRGDIREYFTYAWNLHHHGVFSLAPPQTIPPTPDAYRSPGYPWLLALAMRLRGDDWYAFALQSQVLLGSATVWLAALLAVRWMRPAFALLAALLLALWPHHVAATGALLSEVVFGFTLTAGLYCFARSFDSNRPGWLMAAALVFAYAWLVNPVIALFPPFLTLLIWRERGRRSALWFLGLFLLPMLLWSLRNAGVDAHQTDDDHRIGRATINFVQGSWPQYHHAWQAQLHGDPIGIAIIAEINRETALLAGNPTTGLTTIAARLLADPGYYAKWYLWDKPWLLWGWNIEIGPGGVYVLVVRDSPLATHRLLRWTTEAIRVSNPLLSGLMLGAALALFAGGVRRRPWAPSAAFATGALALYLTAIHTVFQAEPRYANAYRGIEVLLVGCALQWLVARIFPAKT